MQRYEYQVLPAPRRGEKARGAKTMPERFGVALTALFNQMGQDGWEYLRADTLPCEERLGFTGRSTSFQSMLVFRRVSTGGEDLTDDVSSGHADAARSILPPQTKMPRLGAADVQTGTAPAIGPAVTVAPGTTLPTGV